VEQNVSYKAKTWEEKLKEDKGYPKFLKLEENFPCYRALRKMGAEIGDGVVIAPATEVYELMSRVPRGSLQTLEQVCIKLAEKHDTPYCCTLTTGIFITVAANAAGEMNSELPYWRTVKNNGELNKKYPGGMEKQKELLAREGHEFTKKGRKHIRYLVKNYKDKLISL
jgi:alkylated DNA nucleotide flippase Atl1